jgi:hypothetical protein
MPKVNNDLDAALQPMAAAMGCKLSLFLLFFNTFLL